MLLKIPMDSMYGILWEGATKAYFCISASIFGSQFVGTICFTKYTLESHCFYILGLAYDTIFYIPVKGNFYSSFKTKNINYLFFDRTIPTLWVKYDSPSDLTLSKFACPKNFISSFHLYL